MVRSSRYQSANSRSVRILRQDEAFLLPISLLDGPTAEEILLALNLRHDWRGFSFGNFWFGYYFSLPQPSPQVEERLAV
jgi:hypothetical protein